MGESPVLSFHQKFCYYAQKQALTGSAVFGAAFFGAIAQWRADPKEWPQGADGFGRRFGTRYAQGLAKSTTEIFIDGLDHEDPRPHPPSIAAASSLSQTASAPALPVRLRRALLRTVWSHRDTGKNGVAWSRIAGSFASGFLGYAYLPDQQSTVAQAFSRSGTAMGGYFASSVFDEFQPDIFSFVGRLFGRGKPRPARS